MKLKQSVLNLVSFLINNLIGHVPFWPFRRIALLFFGLNVPRSSKIGLNCKLIMPWRIKIGERSIVNAGCHLDGRGFLTIGNDCSISMETMIITATHDVHSDTFDYKKEPVEIRDKVWLGARCIILNGSTVSNGSVIGSGAVFKGSTEEKGIYLGNPALKIADRKISNNYSLR